MQHGVRNLRVHTRCRDSGYAAALFLHKRVRHFLGFVRNDTEFSCRLRAVGDEFVGFAFYVHFKGGKHNRQQIIRGREIVIVEYEEGRTDNGCVDCH